MRYIISSECAIVLWFATASTAAGQMPVQRIPQQPLQTEMSEVGNLAQATCFLFLKKRFGVRKFDVITHCNRFMALHPDAGIPFSLHDLGVATVYPFWV